MPEPKFYYQYYPKLNRPPVYLKLYRATSNRWINDQLYSVYGILTSKDRETGRYHGIVLLSFNHVTGGIKIHEGFENDIYIKKRSRFLRRKTYHRIHSTIDDNLNFAVTYQIIKSNNKIK